MCGLNLTELKKRCILQEYIYRQCGVGVHTYIHSHVIVENKGNIAAEAGRELTSEDYGGYST